MINIIIDGQKFKANKGETILEVARRENIYIPTMCHLTKTTPIASCRMCSVEMEGVDGFILSCQEKAVDGAVIHTNSSELYKHRQNIMKLYDVNHPLQCGVCDKSGECELQNKTLEFGISSQEFTAKEQKRKSKKWKILGYDPYLCIMCERCVHTCNEIVGTSALYIRPNGYNSSIDNDMRKCIQCGECISVCPVGAMISNEFKYSANAWESTQIPAACSHCSSACFLYYDVRHKSIEDPSRVITRVTNEYEFASLCGAGRFGFDFANNNAKKDEKVFSDALEAFKKADTIRFSSIITNEEALILQKLKEKFNYKLVSHGAKEYQKFLNGFAKESGLSLYNGDLKEISKSDMIITLGLKISTDNPMVRFAVSEASKKRGAKIVSMHPIEDFVLQDIVTDFVRYEVGSEEGVMAILAKELLQEYDIESNLQEYFSELDDGYISAETNIGEEEIEEIIKKSKRAKYKTLILGEDLYSHKESKNIALIAGLIEKYSDFKVVIIPPQTNSLGVSLICDLDDKEGDYTIGYNVKGDFTLSALGDGDLDMPALNQQEGTFTNIDKRVVPTNAALSYNGYTLNDIANALGLKAEFTIDYTKQLPKNRGFKDMAFDDLPNYFDNSGNEHRGYKLTNITKRTKQRVPKEPEEIESFDGVVVYRCDPVHQFNEFTTICKPIEEKSFLYGSAQFATAAKIKGGMDVIIDLGEITIKRKFKINKNLKGTVAELSLFDTILHQDILLSKYRYFRVKISMDGSDT